jgi:hypothetical protein
LFLSEKFLAIETENSFDEMHSPYNNRAGFKKNSKQKRMEKFERYIVGKYGNIRER